MDIYAENIMDHFRNPRHGGKLDDLSISHHEENKLCGDFLDVDVKIEKNVLKEAAFRGEGCAISQAGISILLDEIIGMKIDDILALKKNDVYDMLGIEVTARRAKCAILGLLAVQNAILLYLKEKPRIFFDLLL